MVEAVDSPILEEDSSVPISVEQLIQPCAEIGDPKLPAQKPGLAARHMEAREKKHEAAECLIVAVVGL